MATPVTLVDDTVPSGKALGVTGNPLSISGALYPVGSTPLTGASGNKANASAAATLTPSATTTAYISGFEVTGSGATAALPVIVTVTGLLGGTLSFIYNFAAGALVGNQPLLIPFFPPIPASAINTPIVVTCPASGAGGTNNAVVAHGYQV
jgi:hypothetical protein